MSHQHLSRNQSAKGLSVVKHIVQYVFFAVVCIWLLYQMKHISRNSSGCNDIDSKSKEKKMHFGLLLGRKGDVGSSNHAKELELYGVDLIGAAEIIKHNEPGESDAEGKGEEPFEKIAHEVSSIDDQSSETEENKANNPMGDGGEADPNVTMGDVMLESGETVRVVQFSDENGVPDHDSSPSQSNNNQVESSTKGNQSRDSEACDQSNIQDSATRKGLDNFNGKSVHDEEAPKTTVVESEKRSVREILHVA